MENIIEKTRTLINNCTVSEANLASTIVCLAEQLKNLKEFSFRRYVEDTYPELKGNEYVHRVSLLVSESLTLYDPLENLIHSAQNKYLEQLSSDLDKIGFPYEMQKCVTVEYPNQSKRKSKKRSNNIVLEYVDDEEPARVKSEMLFITLLNKDYNINLIISFVPARSYLTFSLSYEMNKCDASQEKRVSDFCYSYEPEGFISEKLLNIFPIIKLSDGVNDVTKLLNDIHSKLV